MTKKTRTSTTTTSRLFRTSRRSTSVSTTRSCSLSCYSSASFTIKSAPVLVNSKRQNYWIKISLKKSSAPSIKKRFQVTSYTKADGPTWVVAATRWPPATKLGWRSTRASVSTWITLRTSSRLQHQCWSVACFSQSRCQSGAASISLQDLATFAHTFRHPRKDKCSYQLLPLPSWWCHCSPVFAALCSTSMYQLMALTILSRACSPVSGIRVCDISWVIYDLQNYIWTI